MTPLNSDLARRFAHSTLGHIDREYPNGLSLVVNGPTEVCPSGLHPIFFGSFDWHSCVHGWWQLMRLARMFPELAPDIYAKAEISFTEEKVRGEMQFLDANAGFERPYGWGWFLALHSELAQLDSKWVKIMAPIAELFSARFQHYLPRLTYPVRAGTHANTTFALVHAFEWAGNHDAQLKSSIEEWSRTRLVDDTAAAHVEPSGEDFLSPTLVEAHLMSRILTVVDFAGWFERFLPTLPENLLVPAEVGDRNDGRIGHLDGLNLSRAWCWQNLSATVPHLREAAMAAADRHFRAALPHLEANYMSEHWLCSFALLALTDY
jgi:hypothetical protein